MPSAELAELRDAVVAWERGAREQPLALWRAWHQPAPRTSQRALLQALQWHKTVIGFGGNRSGKTESLRAASVALALGSDHPDARAFWLANECDPDCFPIGPGKVWIVALTSNDSIRYHRKPILGLLPQWGPPHAAGRGSPVHAWNIDGRGEARVEIMVPGYPTPAMVIFKSEDQGESAMQGDACRAILHDEEGGTSKTWREASVRLWDEDGWHMMSNTPIRGKTWVYRDFVVQKPANTAVVWIHTLDNPWLSSKRKRELAANTDADTARVRLRGDFVSHEGRVWPMFERRTHVIAAQPVPDSATRFRSIDFGTRHPFACVWGALLNKPMQLLDGRTLPDGTLIVYREHYQAEWTLSQHVQHMRNAEQGEVIEMSWADPEDLQQIKQLNYDHDLMVLKARKAIRAGINAVAEYMTIDATRYPRLVVMDSCPNVIREVEGYHWSSDDRDRPASGNDHTCDTLRYLCMGINDGYRLDG